MNGGTCATVREMYFGTMPKTLTERFAKKFQKNLDYYVDKTNKLGIILEDNGDSYTVTYIRLPKQ